MDTIGRRIVAWRRRRNGMTQQVLADRAGLSRSYISLIESDKRPLDRKSRQVAIAGALNISVAQLLGDPTEHADPVRDRAMAHVPVIRSVLVELASGERRSPQRDRETLRELVTEATGLRNAADFATVAPMLPELLLDLGGHGPDMAAEMIEAVFCAQFVLKAMKFPDLAMMAAEVGMRAAESCDDIAWQAQAIYSRINTFPPELAGLGARITARTADGLQGRPSRPAQEMYGRLHLLSALQSAVALEADDALAHLAEAADVANSLGEPDPFGTLAAGFCASWFGPTQVDYWRVAVAAELGDAGAALAVADRIDLDTVPVPNRWVYYWTDMARALAAGDRDREAMQAIAKAERSAPQHFRFNPVIKDLVATLIQRAKRRAVGEEMAAMARRLGLDAM